MKKLISVSIFLSCFVIISAQTAGQAKTPQTTQQKKPPVKTQTTQQKKAPVKTQTTPQKTTPAKTQPAKQIKAQPAPEAAPCKWQKNESDPFSGVSSKTTNWEVAGFNSKMDPAVNNGLTGVYNFSLSEEIRNKDTTYTLMIRTSTSLSLCFNKESKIMIKSGDKIMPINLTGGPVCGKNINSSGVIDPETRKFLKKNVMDLLRIQFTGEGNAIVNVDLKDVDASAKLDKNYFVKTFKCFK